MCSLSLSLSLVPCADELTTDEENVPEVGVSVGGEGARSDPEEDTQVAGVPVRRPGSTSSGRRDECLDGEGR